MLSIVYCSVIRDCNTDFFTVLMHQADYNTQQLLHADGSKCKLKLPLNLWFRISCFRVSLKPAAPCHQGSFWLLVFKWISFFHGLKRTKDKSSEGYWMWKFKVMPAKKKKKTTIPYTFLNIIDSKKMWFSISFQTSCLIRFNFYISCNRNPSIC